MTTAPENLGVNIKLGDSYSAMFGKASEATDDLLGPGGIVRIGEGFRAFRGVDGALFGAPRLYFCQGVDGVGTKTELYQRYNNHRGTAYDLGAMVLDDVLRYGGQAYGWSNILDTGKLDNPDGSPNPTVQMGMRQLAEGLVSASKSAGVPILNGEIAELGASIGGYGDFKYHWGAAAVSVVLKDRVLTGKELRENDIVIGLAEPGMRSNGITNLRNVLSRLCGPEWHHETIPEISNKPLGEVAHLPSTIYHGLVTKLTGGFNPDVTPQIDSHGFAHITGGGWRKLSSLVLGTGLGVRLDDPMQPPALMRFLQHQGNMTDEDAYGTWHMGMGGAIIAPERDVQTILEAAERSGIHAQPVGRLTGSPVIQIVSQGKDTGRLLTFPVRE